LGECFGWCQPAQGLSRSPVEFVGDGVEVGLGVNRQVCGLGEVLAQQPVGVLIRAPLPGAVRITEVDLDTGIDAELHVVAHLFALVPGQAASQGRRQGLDLAGKRHPDGVGVPALGQGHEPHIAGAAFHQRADGRAAVLADDQVTFRKSVARPGGSGVAEVALRFSRSLGMSARFSGVPWLLIEMCAWSLVTDVSAGCPQGS
jgi:hypothetical protein